jgi:protein gp37
MGDSTKIEWTEATWNPWHGCHKVSAGCKNCYMFREKKAYGQDPNAVVRSKTTFNAPLKWVKAGKAPRYCFTCSWSDFFIEEADSWRSEAWEIIRATPQITYQILTKRPERIAAGLPGDWGEGYPNVWLGVSCENQEAADKRIPLLLCTPAAIRFISAEPLLGPINLHEIELPSEYNISINVPGWVSALEKNHEGRYYSAPASLDWVIVGGESGPGARPFSIDWANAIVEQCRAANVPVFVKQLGAHVIQGGERRIKRDKKGGDMHEWPHEIRVREMPA